MFKNEKQSAKSVANVTRERRICIHQIHFSRSDTHTHSACKICIQITYVSDRDAVIFQNYIQSKKAKNMYIILIRKTETFYWMNLRHLRHGRCHPFAFSISFLPCDSYLTILRSATVNPKQMSNQQQRYGDLWRIKYSRSRERERVECALV